MAWRGRDPPSRSRRRAGSISAELLLHPCEMSLNPAVRALEGCSDSFVLDLLFVGFFLSQTKDVFGNDAALLSPPHFKTKRVLLTGEASNNNYQE